MPAGGDDLWAVQRWREGARGNVGVHSRARRPVGNVATARVRERGQLLTRVVWIINPSGVEVFDRRCKQLDAAVDRATLKDGRIVERADIAQVFAWASDRYAHRGIKAALKSGKDVELVTEISLSATGDSTYNRNDLLFDSGWCVTLGRAIAKWAGTEFEDGI